ncbi:MAG: agmatine deiminase family protein [Candidatus Dadabacteria bacterium]|nr:MAG: agmatine deiminase family protein [Candidatus Dadabacteria bacterium]
MAWPSDERLWEHHLEPACREYAEFCRVLAGGSRPERIELLVRNRRVRAAAAEYLEGLDVGFHEAAYGDVWLRDTGPVFVVEADGELSALRFQFNGWGGKYHFPDDDGVARAVASIAGRRLREVPLVCEGGALDVDGQGTCLTTANCVLHTNRNPNADAAHVEELFAEFLGIDRVIWLAGCLAGDHTDGHVDTLARFVRPGTVACMTPSSLAEPNREVLRALHRQLQRARDARGRQLEVVEVPSPGLVRDDGGRPAPASYLNFYIGDHVVLVPVYGTPYDERALAVIQSCFADRRVVGVPSLHVLSGGGSWHCVTRQEPRLPEE